MSDPADDEATWQPPAVFDADTACPKCASRAVTTEFCDQSTETWMFSIVTPRRCWVQAGYWEHLHRECVNCGHSWLQRPADADAAEFDRERVQARGRLLEEKLEADRREADRRRELAEEARERPSRRRWWQR